MNPTTTADPYERLGIRQNASWQEIEKAYREMAVKWHPDRHRGQYKEFAREQFKAVQEAHEILSKSAGSQQTQSSSAQSNPASSQPHAGQSCSSSNNSQQSGSWKAHSTGHSSASKQSSSSGQSYNSRQSNTAYQPSSNKFSDLWQSLSHLYIQFKKIGKIEKFVGIGIAGMTIAASAYFGNEYILKCSLEREIRKKDSFYSETVKLIKTIKNKDYANSFGMNIQLEAMIKLGEKRKYDVSGLQRIDERIDKELIESAKEIGLAYSRELKDKRVKIEEDWCWHKGWLAKLIHQIFKGKIKSPDYNIHDSELAAGYVRALKEARLNIRGKYEGMKVRDREAFDRLKDYFENQAKWLGSESRAKCMNKIRGL
jgi:curved DNA-binding protein CbpA